MCRTGGRRCPSSGGRSRGGSAPVSAGHAGDNDERESYEGTPWQGYDEYMQRSADLDRRIAGGESITDIMRAEQLKRGEERIAQIAREGW